MKTTNTFGVQFIIRNTKDNENEALVYLCITVNKKRLEISLKRTIDPLYGDSSGGCVKGNKDLPDNFIPISRKPVTN